MNMGRSSKLKRKEKVDRVAPKVSVETLSFDIQNLDLSHAASTFTEQGAIVVRGLLKSHIPAVKRDIMRKTAEAISMLDQATRSEVGWNTPDGSLFIPAPPGYDREQQIMVVAVNYHSSAAFFYSALDTGLLDLVEAILGPNIETYNSGQVLVKEPVGGHPKHLHQDSAYFEHKFLGPVGVLTYCVDTSVARGALHVIPGSHRLGQLDHVDTFSHLGLDEDEWPWEAALPIEGQAGDSIFFNVKTIHGSKPNFTDVPRPAFVHRFRRPDDYVIASGTTVRNRRSVEHDASSQTKGLMVRGIRVNPESRS